MENLRAAVTHFNCHNQTSAGVQRLLLAVKWILAPVCFMFYLINDYERDKIRAGKILSLAHLWTTEAFCCDRGSCWYSENPEKHFNDSN